MKVVLFALALTLPLVGYSDGSLPDGSCSGDFDNSDVQRLEALSRVITHVMVENEGRSLYWMCKGATREIFLSHERMVNDRQQAYREYFNRRLSELYEDKGLDRKMKYLVRYLMAGQLREEFAALQNANDDGRWAVIGRSQRVAANQFRRLKMRMESSAIAPWAPVSSIQCHSPWVENEKDNSRWIPDSERYDGIFLNLDFISQSPCADELQSVPFPEFADYLSFHIDNDNEPWSVTFCHQEFEESWEKINEMGSGKRVYDVQVNSSNSCLRMNLITGQYMPAEEGLDFSGERKNYSGKLYHMSTTIRDMRKEWYLANEASLPESERILSYDQFVEGLAETSKALVPIEQYTREHMPRVCLEDRSTSWFLQSDISNYSEGKVLRLGHY